MPPAGTLPARWQSRSIFSAKPQPAGSLIATACSDGVLRLWDLRSGSLANTLSIPLFDGMTAACAWEPNGHCIASAATGGDICALVSFHRSLWSWRGLLASCVSGSDQHHTPVMSSSRVRSSAYLVIEINIIQQQVRLHSSLMQTQPQCPIRNDFVRTVLVGVHVCYLLSLLIAAI